MMITQRDSFSFSSLFDDRRHPFSFSFSFKSLEEDKEEEEDCSLKEEIEDKSNFATLFGAWEDSVDSTERTEEDEYASVIFFFSILF